MIGSRNYSGKSTGLRPGWVLGFFLVSCVFHLQTFSLTDDHFDRISRAHQIAQYGELPYRDFFDPGYFLTLFSSAAAQSVFGGVLLGEAVIAILGLSLGFSLTPPSCPSYAILAARCAHHRDSRIRGTAFLRLRQGLVLFTRHLPLLALY